MKETKEQKATLAELIYRSQKGEEIEVYVTDDLDEIVSPVEVFDFKKWLEHHEWNSKDLLKPQTFKYRIKPRTVTITREQLAEVYGSEYGISTDILLDTNAKGSFVNICKKLGLSHD